MLSAVPSHVQAPCSTVPLARLLSQLGAVIAGLTDAQYRSARARCVSGTIGGHVRHVLDHVEAFLGGLGAGHINYDLRRRGTAVETSRESALAEIRRLVQAVEQLSAVSLDRRVEVAGALETDGPEAHAASSAARELAFVVSHTIHHMALIALLLWEQGISVPPRFGYAPSTPSTSAA